MSMPKKSKKPGPELLPHLRYVESLLDGNGDITLGRVASIKCVATACDEDMQLAMLVRRERESLVQLLTRLNTAIELAYERQQFIDEVNNGPDYSI